jgi:hypothetical protein
MRDRYEDRRDDPGPPRRDEGPRDHTPLMPGWLARSLLERGEVATWVRGPGSCPWWEPYLTHPLACLVGIPVGAACLTVGRLAVPDWSQLPPAAAVSAILTFFVPLMVVAFLTGHFTRLVVTDRRLLIIQGQTVIRSWGIRQLPRSLVKYVRREGEDEAPTIDLDSLQKMLGGKSDGIVDSNTIMSLGKKLDRFKTGD